MAGWYTLHYQYTWKLQEDTDSSLDNNNNNKAMWSSMQLFIYEALE